MFTLRIDKLKFTVLIFCLVFIATGSGFPPASGQIMRNALFLGNSYTYANDLPQLIAGIAESNSDTLKYDSYTPGGYTFQLHSTDPAALAKIFSRPWDYVILQEQSQQPSFPPVQVATLVYPFADSLNQRIKENDSCSRTLFFMTWGRKNGDYQNCPGYPPVCTYNGMQARLKESYLEMSQMFDAEVSPVGMVWKYTRDNFPGIELYQADESHPSLAGSYLAACTFYAAMFHKSPLGSWFPASLSASDAHTLQQNAGMVVLDSLGNWHIDTTTLHSGFTCSSLGNNTFQFTSLSYNAQQYYWSFGDSTTSTDPHPVHHYLYPGFFTVSLLVYNHCLVDSSNTELLVLAVETTGQAAASMTVFPNPASSEITFRRPFFGPLPAYHYCIMNKLGKTLMEGEGNGLSTCLDISGLTAGFYILSINELYNVYPYNRLNCTFIKIK